MNNVKKTPRAAQWAVNFFRQEQAALTGMPPVRYKFLLKPALYSFIMYLAAISAILRANFNYIDDAGRSVWGYRIWDTSSRYVNQHLSVLLHTNERLTDISPLTQILAAGILAVCSVALVYVLTGGKVTIPRLACALPLGLSPYFLNCISYKFDAPYMALSVAAGIVPFLFANARRWQFGLVSVVCLLVMCMTYQASSGVYIILLLLLCFREWNEKGRSGRDVWKFLLFSGFLYIISLLIYKVFLMHPVDSYYSTELFPISEMGAGIAMNLGIYIFNLVSDSSHVWLVLILVVAALFVAVSVMKSQRGRFLALWLSVGAVALSFFVSYGIYLAMQKPQFEPRAMLGSGVLLAALCITAVQIRPRPFALPVFALCWCLFTFSFTYGNALAEQKHYVDFRTEILAADLSRTFPTEDISAMTMRIEGSAGYATPIEKNIAKRYPVIKRMVPILLCSTSEWYRAKYELFEYHQWGGKDIIDREIPDGLPTVLDTHYHTIKSDGEQILVILK